MSKGEKFCFLCFSLVFLLLLAGISYLPAQQKPLTVAESSQFKATSRYADVINFIQNLEQQSNRLRVEKLCLSSEGRYVPLLIIGDPPPSSPLDLKGDDRAVIYIEANIHAGEVEAKEASLMLARDIVLAKRLPYLDKLVILMAPIFNADGNEKISPENRRNQHGPEEGVGVRYNGQYLDLNRDAMKLETPEVRGLVQNVLCRWDPVLFFDGHTHNGSYHREPVTYVWGLNPNGDSSIIAYLRDEMMSAISHILKKKYKILSIPHGDFMDVKNPDKGWQTLGPQPRYITNYIGLRNRLAILNENYPYTDFKTRVYGCYHFLKSILDYCSAHKNEIKKLIAQADRKTILRGLNPSPKDTFAVKYDLKPMAKKLTILGYEMKVTKKSGNWPQVKIIDKKRTYHPPYYCNYIAKRTVQFPYAYLIPFSFPEVKEKLLQHGIVVERLTRSVTLEVQSFKIKEIKSQDRIYQGHRLNTVKGEYRLENKEFPAGTLFIGTAQPLANVIAYLLEPESDDGFFVWNFFDRYLVPEWGRGYRDYPVYKLLHPTFLAKKVIRE